MFHGRRKIERAGKCVFSSIYGRHIFCKVDATFTHQFISWSGSREKPGRETKEAVTAVTVLAGPGHRDHVRHGRHEVEVEGSGSVDAHLDDRGAPNLTISKLGHGASVSCTGISELSEWGAESEGKAEVATLDDKGVTRSPRVRLRRQSSLMTRWWRPETKFSINPQNSGDA